MPGHVRRRGKSFAASVEVPHRDNKRKRAYGTFSTERQANHFVADRTIAVGTETFVAPSNLTLEEVFDLYLKSKHQAESTGRVYRSFGNRMVKELGAYRMQSITMPMLDEFVGTLRTTPRLDSQPGVLSERTVDHLIRQTKALFAWAARHRHIARDVAAELERITDPESRDMVILTVAETKAMLAAAVGTALEAGLWLAAMVGLRRGEVLGLRWRDVDMDRGQLTVAHGIGYLRTGLGLKRPKTVESRRTLLLSPQAVEVLRRVRANQVAQFAIPPDFVCPDQKGATWWRPSAFSSAFVVFLRQQSLPHMRLHDLRHTHASQLIAAGVHLKTISVRLGHKNIKTTADKYGHLIPGVEESAVRLLEQLYE